MRLPNLSQLVADHWPAVAASVVLAAVLFWPWPASDEVPRAVASVGCMSLVSYDWNLERKRKQARPGLLLSSLLLVPGLAALWLGLNVVRFYSYAPEVSGNLYYIAVRTQEVIQWSSVGVLLAILGLLIVHVSRRLLRRLG